MLSLGCHAGELERSLRMLHDFDRCDGVDFSHENIERARAEAMDLGYGNLAYEVQDLNRIDLSPNTYDAVWLNLTLGGVEKLEHVIDQIARSLKPGGLLFANEYIGANRFATRRAQREVIRAAFAMLPRRFRDFEELTLPGRDGLDGAWPIRSQEIVDVLRRRFYFDEFNPICGSIVQFVLKPVLDRLGGDPAAAGPVPGMLFWIEETLVDSGEMAADYAMIVGRLKS
jgi:SAM-dependent methyltransferase